MDVKIEADASNPLELTTKSDPRIHFRRTPKVAIAIDVEAEIAQAKSSLPIRLVMAAPHAAALLRLLLELRDQGLLSEATGKPRMNWRQ